MRKSTRRGAALAAVFLSALLSLSAQDNSGTVRGTIRGGEGKPISNAGVVAKNLETGQSRTASSNEAGQFEISGLAAGLYAVEVSGTGFVSQTLRDVRLVPAQSLALEWVLQSSAESAPAAAPVERISESQLVGLPLNGRSYSQLATLQAGVADTSSAQASRGTGGGSLTVSGGRSSSNNFLQDGINIMDAGNQAPRSAAGVQLGSDAVYQVQVFSTNYGAEYGRGSGGVLNSITRSGNDQFHGTLFEYLRNSDLDTRNVIDPDSEPPPFKRNQFGFTVSGPVRTERTYFSTSFEAMRDRLTQTDLNFFPDDKARQGVITDEQGNELRRIELDPAIVDYLALFPRPNLGSAGGGLGLNAASVFLPTDENYWSLRLDHKLSERDSFFLRYTLDDANSTDKQSTYLFQTLTSSRSQYLTLVGTHIFGLRFLTAFRLGYTRPVNSIRTVSSVPIASDLYFVSGAPQLGTIDIPGVPTFGPSFTTPEGNTLNTFQLADDLVLQRGPHALKFGGEVHRYRTDVFNGYNKSGAWTFSSLDSFLGRNKSGTGLSVALPGSNNKKAFRQTFLGLYIQDNYRMSDRLQFSFGLRYEFASIVEDTDNRLVFLPDPMHDSAVQVGTILKDNPSLLNFSPRVGLTWSPGRGQNTVLSAGFGIYADPLLEYVVDQQKNTAPFHKVAVIPNLDATGVFPRAADAVLQNSLGSLFQVQVLDYNGMRLPQVLRYNLTLQRQFGAGLRVQAAYVGARGNHLVRAYDANLYPFPVERLDGSLFFPPNEGPLNPAFGSIAMTSSDAQSFYNSLQFSANKSFGRALSLQASYTYAKSVDDASSANSGPGGNPSRQYPFMRTSDRGLSDFDLRQRVSINYFYMLPMGAGQRWWKSGIVSQILGGWRMGGIVSFRAGTPFHPRVNVRPPGYLFVANRPNLLPGRSNNPTEGTTAGCAGIPEGQELGGPARYFDPCSFSPPEPGTLGNVGRNTIIGPSVFSMDVSLQKEIPLGAERSLQFRGEIFNVPNHPSFAKPSAGASIVYSGASARLNTTAGRLTQPATTSRQIQFALRLTF